MDNKKIKENDKLLIENYINLMWGEFNEIRGKYQLAPLILAFSLIEANAKLCYPNALDGTKKRFIWWIEEYLNKVSQFQYKPIDLYGSRCGLFHEYGSESDLSRDGKCCMIAWTSGGDNRHHGKGKDNLMLLSKEQFFEDLCNAGLLVLKNLQNDIELQNRFVSRLRNMFGIKNIEKDV